jgi:hypothetical protein
MFQGKRLLIMAVIVSFLFVPLGAAAAEHGPYRQAGQEQQPATVTSGYITADIFAARPVGVVSTLLGAATFVIASPFSALGGNLEHSFDELVKKPFLYTFKRPIGVF